jgi:polysaccharide biosynthesis transport protein
MKKLGPAPELIDDLDDHCEALVTQPHNGSMVELSAINNPGAEPYADESPHLRDHWRSIRNHWVMVVGLTAIITSAVAIFFAFKPNMYEADVQVQVDLENVNPQLRSVKTSSFIVNPVTDPAYFNTQLQLPTRPWLLRRVIKTLDLEHNPAFAPPPQSGVSAMWTNLLTKLRLKGAPATYDFNHIVDDHGGLSPAELAEATRLEPYVELLQLTLDVEPVKENRLPIKDTRLITISFSCTDPQLATKVANTIADTFVLSNLEKKNDLTTVNAGILQKRIAEIQAQVRSGEEKLINYAKEHEILSLDPSQNTVVDRLAGLNRQLLEAENDRKLAEAAYRAALAPGAADALAQAAARDTDDSENRLAELRERRAQLLVQTTEEWPQVKELDQQIVVLEKHIKVTHDRATSVTVTNLETRYRETLAREQALRTAFNQQRGDTLKQNEAAIYYRIMQQEVETSKNLLDGLLQQQKENDGMTVGMTNNIRVNDYASVPQVPVGPRRLLFTAIAFAMSLGFSVGLAIFTDYMDDSVSSTEDVEKVIHTRTLASIPAMSEARVSLRQLAAVLSKRNGHSGDLKAKPSLRQLTAGLAKRNGNSRDPKELILDNNGHSGLTEVYRQLRTSMLLSSSGGALRTILVAAGMPGEGKTTTAINTALSLARAGGKVLLIDADSRNPSVHGALGIDNDEGLSTILSSANQEAEALLYTMIKRHETSGLFVLTSGPPDPSFTELLGSERMRRLLTTIRGNFNYAIVDSPPLVQFADGALIAQMVDGVLLVVNSGKTSREIVRQSRQILRDVGASIIGVVLNNVKIHPYDYSYYEQYYSRDTKRRNGNPAESQAVSTPESSAVSSGIISDQQILPYEITSSESLPPTSN